MRWRSKSPVRLVIPTHPESTTELQIERCIRKLKSSKSPAAVTPALPISVARRFIDAGFMIHEELHLLSLSLHYNKATRETAPLISNARPWHTKQVLELDKQCFDRFWTFDRHSFHRARKSTRQHISRIWQDNGHVLGYCVTGAVQHMGYIQRLGVSPANRGQGIGSALVEDSLNWLGVMGCTTAMVNTQLGNSAALDLYEKLGFALEPEGLVVLKWQRN